ncbi:MAG: DUF433 domain-containing protein [Thermomicrobiales bacterium]
MIKDQTMFDRQDFETRVTRNPAVLGGKPIIRGTRIPVSLVTDWLGAGVSIEQILEDYPNLAREDIEAAAAYRQFEQARTEVRSW